MKHTKKHIDIRYKKKTTARIKHNVVKIIKFTKLDKLSFDDYKRYSRIIIDMKKSENIPILGYWTPTLLEKLRKEQNTYIILENNRFIGLVLFYNLSESFRKKMLGSVGNNFKSQADISSYLFYYTFIDKDREINKRLCDDITNLFIQNNNLKDKNFFIVMLKYFTYNTDALDIINKWFPIIDNAIKGVSEYKKLGFEYNGAHITMNNEIYNVFMKRYLNKNGIDVSKYYPTYVITRQLKNDDSSHLEYLENMMQKDGLFLLQNVYKFCLNNTFVYYNNLIDNGVYSLYKGAPYEFYFIPNYLTNELGNNHIICHYAYLYNALIDYYGGEKAKELENFARIVKNRDDVYKMLDEGKYINLRNFYMLSDNIVINRVFNNKDKYIQYIDDKKNYLPYGYYNMDITFQLNLVPILDNNLYHIVKQILFTYIDNELKVYINDKGIIMIRNYSFKDITNIINPDTSYSVKKFPDDLPILLNEPINNTQITNINESIAKSCKNIAKMYKKHVSNDINQINGFRIIHLYMRLIKINGQYKIVITNTTYYNELYKKNSYENSLWINEVAIRPALYKGYKTKEIGAQYQPVNYD